MFLEDLSKADVSLVDNGLSLQFFAQTLMQFLNLFRLGKIQVFQADDSGKRGAIESVIRGSSTP